MSGGQCEFPDGLFYGGVRPAWSNGVLRQVLREHGAQRAHARLDRLPYGLGPRGHGEKIFAGRDDRRGLRARQGMVGRRRDVVPRRLVDVGAADRRQLQRRVRRVPAGGVRRHRARIRHAAVRRPCCRRCAPTSGSPIIPTRRPTQSRADQARDPRRVLPGCRRLEGHGLRAGARAARGARWRASPPAAQTTRMNDRDRALARAAVAADARCRRRGTATSPGASAIRRWRSASLAVFAVCVLRRAVRAVARAAQSVRPAHAQSVGRAVCRRAWVEGGNAAFLLGTDDQGRDVLSAIMFGARVSLLVGLASVAFALVLGVVARPASPATSAARSTRSSCASPTCSCRSRPS